MDNNSYKDMADNKIASFDRTFCTDHIRMLKICLHYIPEAYRRNLIIYIKYLELQQALTNSYQLQHAQNIHFTPETIHAEHSAEEPRYNNSRAQNKESAFPDMSGFGTLIQELLPFCNPREKQQFRNIENIMNSMEQLKNIMEMMEMMKDMKDMFGDSEGGFTPEMFSGMMGMDGLDLGSFFGNNFTS